MVKMQNGFLCSRLADRQKLALAVLYYKSALVFAYLATKEERKLHEHGVNIHLNQRCEMHL
jgi:hypothetical protein